MNFGIGRVKYSNLYLSTYNQYYDDMELTTQAVDTDASREVAAIAHLANKASNNQTADALSVIIEGVDYVVETAFTAGADADDADAVTFAGLADATNLATIAEDDDTLTNTTRSEPGDSFTAIASGTLTTGTTGRVAKAENQLIYAASEGMYHADADGNPNTNLLTNEIETVQALINTARVQAGSQYAALESAVNYTTDLTAQYELGYNTVNDVNFSMETAHLAKNQILQQAATAMLAQANQGQQGLLQLIS